MGCGKVAIKLKVFFCHSEKEFKSFTNDFKTTIDNKLLLTNILKDGSVSNDFKYVYESADRKVDKEVAKKLLESLVLLYIRVRPHSSYAKKRDAQSLQEGNKEEITSH